MSSSSRSAGKKMMKGLTFHLNSSRFALGSWRWQCVQIVVFIKVLSMSTEIQCFNTKSVKYVNRRVFKATLSYRKSTFSNDVFENDDGTNAFMKPTTNTILTVPIFPLRKKVRLPTEELQLNLYEERYIQLAEYVYRQKSEINSIMKFGAIYTSDMPQIVTGKGYGPVVPIIQPGDIGVLYIVNDWIERTSYKKPSQRVIQMNAIGGLRFRILSIINDGSQTTINDSSTFVSTDSENLPFILATVQLFLGNFDKTETYNFGFVPKLVQFLKRDTTSMKDLNKNACNEKISFEQIRFIANQTVTLMNSELSGASVQDGYHERLQNLVEKELLFFAEGANTISDIDTTMRLNLLANM